MDMFIKLSDVSPDKLAALHALATSDQETQKDTNASYLAIAKSSLNDRFGTYTVEVGVPILATGFTDGDQRKERKDRVGHLTARTIVDQVFDILGIFPELPTPNKAGESQESTPCPGPKVPWSVCRMGEGF